MAKVYVLYHSSCMDGAGARYAAWSKFKDEAVYIPVQYNKPPPDIEEDSHVYILDFSYPREILKQMNEKASKLVVLDHHKTAKEQLEGLSFAHFDLSKSGAVLAWEYFHPDKPVPTLLLNVQDRDLWKFEMKATREVVAGFRKHQDDMLQWDMVVSEELTDETKTYPHGSYLYNKIRTSGKAILDYEKSLVNSALRNVQVVNYLGYRVGVVNATNIISEIGTAIYEDPKLNVDFSISFFILVESAAVVLSFRSKGNVDVSALAKRLGGGGHPGASGAHVSLQYLQDLIKGNLWYNDDYGYSKAHRLQELQRKPWIDHNDRGGPLLHCIDGKARWISWFDRFLLKMNWTTVEKLNDSYSSMTLLEQKEELEFLQTTKSEEEKVLVRTTSLPDLSDGVAMKSLSFKLASAIADAFPPGTVSDDMERSFALPIHATLVNAAMNQSQTQDISVSVVDAVLDQYTKQSGQTRYRAQCLERVRAILKNE